MQLLNSRYKNIELAEVKYSTPEQLNFKQTVAKEVRIIANVIYPNSNLPAWNKKTTLKGKLLKQVDRYVHCGMEYIKIQCRDCDQVYVGPKRCESRICKECSRKYTARIRANKFELMKSIQPTKRNRYMFLTVTKKTNPNRSPSSNDMKQIFNSFRKLVNELYPRKKGCGTLAVMEIGKNNNIHIHAIVYGYYVSQKKLSNLWFKITGDSKIVDIREIKGLKRGLNYILKYLTKSPQFDDPKKLASYLNLLIGFRRIRTYGIFYNCPLLKKDLSKCVLCSGRLKFVGFDIGTTIPNQAILFEVAYKLDLKNKTN